MERTSVELPAGTIHHREAGPADGRPVVFVHGFLVDDTLWSDVPERLAERGFRTIAPTWPLGSHATAMNAGTDLSPRGVARIVASFLEVMDVQDVVRVASDTGGAVSQLLLDEDPSRIGRLVLTNCDAFDTFPPFPFDLLFRLARHEGPTRAVLQSMRSTFLRNSKLGFGWLVRRDLAPEESRRWVTPYLADAGVRRDVATFARGWRPDELADSARWLGNFDKPVLLAWAPGDPFFKHDLAKRLLATFPDATLLEFRGARTFVSLDQPERLADEIAAWVGVGPRA
jgi:pimeloyl-ACP methyl ester carboxylesterase